MKDRSPIRTRYLIKDPDVLVVDVRGKEKIAVGEWRRVWAKTWRDYPGEKKIVSGRCVVIHVAALEGWS